MKKAVLWLLAILSTLFAGCSNEATSVGIIGGADGPTALLVSSKRIRPIIVITIVSAVIVGIILYNKKRK
jgi:Na+-transporting methylmalonyl-CoA/oxaloacetate decarboxylase beta subunit